MSEWIEIGGPGNHRIQLLEGGGVLWEHDTTPGYWVPRHTVDPAEGETWEVVQIDPISLTPSLHCDRSIGGCGMHGFITEGEWH